MYTYYREDSNGLVQNLIKSEPDSVWLYTQQCTYEVQQFQQL